MQNSTTPPRLRIGELARLSGLTVRTLHHYEQLGLLRAPSRNRGRHRLYDASDAKRLYRICALRDLGLSLAEIARLNLDDRKAFGATLHAHLARVDEELQRLTDLRKMLVQACSRSDGDVSVEEVFATIEAMSRVVRRSRMRKEPKPSSAATTERWRELGLQLRRCLTAGESPRSARVRKLAQNARALLVDFAGGDPTVLDALAHLRKVTSPVELAGWDAPLLRYLDSALEYINQKETFQ